MSIKYIFFDLDGTLLPMDQEVFTREYFKRLCQAAAPHGYEPDALIKATWSGTAAMVKNDGTRTNEEAFWSTFATIYGEEKLSDKPIFDSFYSVGFEKVRPSCGFTPDAAAVVDMIKSKGLHVVLATNPLFPRDATLARIRWAGLDADDFEIITTYENSRHTKPNPAYYSDIVAALGCRPEECMMVGNDVAEDMIAETIGMRVFLLTDCLINKQNADITSYENGGFEALKTVINTL